MFKISMLKRRQYLRTLHAREEARRLQILNHQGIIYSIPLNGLNGPNSYYVNNNQQRFADDLPPKYDDIIPPTTRVQTV